MSSISTANADSARKTSHAGFLDLSAEVRNSTYTMVLVHKLPFIISGEIEAARGAEITLMGHRTDNVMYGYSQGVPQRTYGHEQFGTGLESTNAHFLRTCRKIQIEATPIFFGLNTFVLVPELYSGSARFNTLNGTLKAFQARLDSSTKYIRLLRLAGEWNNISDLAKCLNTCKKFPSLARLDITTFRLLRVNISPAEAALLVRPLLNSIALGRGDQHSTADIGDVVCFDSAEQWEGLKATDADIKPIVKAEAEAYVRAAKKELRKLLGNN